MAGGLVVSVLLVRTLGVSQYGTYAFTLGTVQVAAVLGGLGVGLGISRMSSFYQGEQAVAWAQASLRISIKGGLALTAVVLALEPFVPPAAKIPLLVASPLVMLEIVRSAQAGFLFSQRRVLMLEGTNIGMLIATTTLVYLVVLAGARTPSPVLCAQVVPKGAAILLLGLGWRRIAQRRAIAGRPSARKILAFSVPLMLQAVSMIVLSRSDVILLAVLAGSRAAGTYAPILQIFDVTALIVASIGSYLMAVGSALVREKDYVRLRDAYTSLTKWGAVVTLPLLVTMLVLPVPVLTALFGSSFVNTGDVARVLAVAYTVNVITGVNFIVLAALGATRQIAYRSLSMIALNIALNVVLIPRYGALGAALGTAIAMVSVNVVNSLLIWRMAGVHPIRTDTIALIGGIAFATLASDVVVRLLPPGRQLLGSLIVLVLSGGAAILIALLTLRPYESALLRSLVPARRGLRGPASP